MSFELIMGHTVVLVVCSNERQDKKRCCFFFSFPKIYSNEKSIVKFQMRH